jgi:hypothetical protein
MYCGQACAAKTRWEGPAYRSKVVSSFQARSNRQRAVASARMKRLNQDPDIMAKRVARMRNRPFAGTRGGNGQLTPEQEALHRALGWPMEYAIPTGNPKWSTAIVDLAHPALQIAVECDGSSHHTAKQKNRDARKVSMLAELGWIVLRFWNAEITSNLASVLLTIEDAVQARSSALA